MRSFPAVRTENPSAAVEAKSAPQSRIRKSYLGLYNERSENDLSSYVRLKNARRQWSERLGFGMMNSEQLGHPYQVGQ
jgi:hypothetical protein